MSSNISPSKTWSQHPLCQSLEIIRPYHLHMTAPGSWSFVAPPAHRLGSWRPAASWPRQRDPMALGPGCPPGPNATPSSPATKPTNWDVMRCATQTHIDVYQTIKNDRTIQIKKIHWYIDMNNILNICICMCICICVYVILCVYVSICICVYVNMCTVYV